MNFSKWREDDGFHECWGFLSVDTPPSFRVRAVLDSNGRYVPVVRDFQSGRELSRGLAQNDLDEIKKVAINRTVSYVVNCTQNTIENHCPCS